MKTLNLKQGSDEWVEVRGQYPTASEASVMMGESKQCSRAEMLRMKATGDKEEFSKWVEEVLFEQGKEVEIKARPIAEKIIGEDLYPVVGLSDDKAFLASFDGVTIDDSTIWECKQWNEEKAECVRRGYIPECDLWQVVQQLVVSGAEYCLYMVTDAEERTVTLTYTLDSEDKTQLLSGWKQFYEDLKNYQHVEVVEAPVGRAPEQLPSLSIQVTGKVTESNLSEFKEHALAVFGSINKELKTDEDFANAKKAVKWCKEVEDKLEATKAHALSQTESIERMFNTIDEMKSEARTVRLELDKLVIKRSKDVRGEILQEAKDKLVKHVARMNSTLDDGFYIPLQPQTADFAGAMKNKRNITSMRDAVDQVLAETKIAVNEVCATMVINVKALKDDAKNHNFLFKDYAEIVLKDPEDLLNLIKSRIADYEKEESDRIEALAEEGREKIRKEEEKKATNKAYANQKIESWEKVSDCEDVDSIVAINNILEFMPKSLDDERLVFEDYKASMKIYDECYEKISDRKAVLQAEHEKAKEPVTPVPMKKVEETTNKRTEGSHYTGRPRNKPVVEVEAPKPAVEPEVEEQEVIETPAAKCDGNHGGPKCDDPECWNTTLILNGCDVELYSVAGGLQWKFEVLSNGEVVGVSNRRYLSREVARDDANLFTEILCT